MPRCRAWVALPVGVLAGCATVTSVDGERHAISSDAFRSYAETVFRRQNAALSELAFALDGSELAPEQISALEAVEADLIGTCAALNELAIRRRDNRDVGVRGQLDAARSVPDCERVVIAAERLLVETGPK